MPTAARKPRPAAKKAPAKAVKPRTPEQTITRAKQVATKAINAAAIVASDQSKNRSTRSRAAYQIKAEALDQVARILGGKE